MVREILKLITDTGLGDKNPSFHGIEITDYNFNSPRMGMPTLTAALMWPVCLDDEWTHKEYVELRGEKYYIRQTQTSGISNDNVVKYKHSLEFKSEREQLTKVYFYDVVPSFSATYDRPNTNSTEFKFFGTIREYADRLNCAFRYAGIGDSILDTKTTLTDADVPVGDGYCVVVSSLGGGDLTVTKEMSFSDQWLWDALVEGYNQYKIPFAFRGKKIVFNEYVEVTGHVFKYGYDNSLLSVKKTNANAKLVNRITFKGSSENIPYFYPNETEYGHITLVASASNHSFTAANTSIDKANLLTARLSQGDTVTLVHKGKSAPVSSVTIPTADATSGDWFTIYATAEEAAMFVDIKFTVERPGEYFLNSLKGQSWRTFAARPFDGEGVTELVDACDPSQTTLNRYGSSPVSRKVPESEAVGYIPLGYLETGEWTLSTALRMPVQDVGTWAVRLYGAAISDASYEVKEGFYWRIGKKDYASLAQVGLSSSVAPTMDAVGDSFSWTASGRMPFQTNLVPPKYRQTGGTERFYNALNDTYSDGNGGYLSFPNPYTEGNPSEHIYEDESIKPTIEGVTNASGQLLGVVAGLAYDSDDSDSMKPGTDEESGKNDSKSYEHSFFYMRLNAFSGAYGFDLFKSASQTDPMTIQMTSGKCNGCKFKIQVIDDKELDERMWRNPVQVDASGDIVDGTYTDKVDKDNPIESQQDTRSGSVWICVQKDAETFGVIMPNRSHSYMPAVGDTFNIINIDLPMGYILAAEKRGEEAMLRFMADNNEEKFDFDISASRIFFAENKELLASLDENSRIKIEYNGKQYVQYVSTFGIECRDNEPLPDVKLGLTGTISAGQSFIEEIKSSIPTFNPAIGGGGAGGGLSADLADARYLRKDQPDRTPHKVASDEGFEAGTYASGLSGGFFGVEPETGKTYLETDFLKVRLKAVFEELMVSKTSSVRGEQIITPGGSVELSFVEDTPSGYKCHFKSKDDDKGAECSFVPGDQVKCKEFNISDGTHSQASNQYYWRKVNVVNNDEGFIVLSKTDCAEGSGIPAAGDTVCQLGNKTDKGRQSAIVLSTVDGNAPSVTLYNGIGSGETMAEQYSLNLKAVVEYGVDKTKTPPQPFFNCYGRFYYGPRDKTSFLEFDPAVGKLVFKGSLSISSTVGDDTLEDYIKQVSPPVKREDIEDFVNAIVDPKIDGIQDQIDGVIETWFYNGVPTLTSYPASEWSTDNLKIQHLGDLYYDNDTGTAYRFSQDAQGAFYWNVITDDAITKALAAAQKAQDTADKKRRVFTAQPEPPYDKGDLWVNATYGSYVNELLRCFTPKEKGEAFSIDDWDYATKYTDDSALNDFIAGYEDTIDDIKGQIDGKAETWYQNTDPSVAWTTAEAKAAHVGDLWYNTTDNTTWYWNGSSWKQQTVPQSVFDTIDGKGSIFVAKPTDGYRKNDLWFLEADYTLSGVAYKAGTLVVAIRDMGTAWSANDWTKKDRYTDDTLAQQAKDAADAAKAKADKAEQDAKAAKDRLDAWAADGVISPTEKQGIKDEIARIDADKAHITAEYTRYGLGTPTAYNNAHSAYRAQLVALSAATPENITIPSTFASNQTAYYNQRTEALKAIAAAAKKYAEDVAKQEAAKAVAGYEYLKKALADVTTISGGLMLSSQIRLGQHNADFTTQTTWAGHNGVYASGRTIGSWWGGDMLDLFKDNDTKKTADELGANARPAAALVRMDGSAYFSAGNIGFRKDGSGWLGNQSTGILFGTDGTMTFGSGIKISTTSGDETLQSLVNFMQGLAQVFIPEDSSGNKVAWNASTLARVKSTVGFYSMGFISAMGLNTGGTSGGGGGGGATTLAALNDVILTSLASGHILVYDGNKWVNQAMSPGLDTSALDAYLVSNNYLTQGTADSRYVTALGTSGNYLTWTKNGAVNNITVPFATATSIVNSNGRVDALTGGSLHGQGIRLYEAYINGYPADYGNVLAVQGGAGGAGELLLGWSGINGAYASLYYRNHRDNTADWSPWVTILDSSNFNTLIGSNLTAYVTLSTAQTISGAKTFSAELKATNKVTFLSEGKLKIWGVASTRNSTYGNEMVFVQTSIDSADPETSWPDKNRNDLFLQPKGGHVHIGPIEVAQNNTLYVAGDIKATSGITAASFIRSGGTSSQFLMADGSVTTKHVLSTVTNLGWSGTAGQIPTTNTLAYWNGAHSGTSSNLAYCNKGAFGTIVTMGSTQYARALTNSEVLAGDMNEMFSNKIFLGSGNFTANTPNGNGWYNVIQVSHRNAEEDGSSYVGQIALGMTVNHEQMYFRTHRTRTWQHVLTTSAAAATYLPKSSYTASDVLSKIKTVDGSGSGLDADLLDGVHNGHVTAKLINGSNAIASTNITTPGFYYFDGNPANIADKSPTPGNSWNFSMVVLGHTANRTKQLALEYSTGRVYTRIKINDWSGWKSVAFTTDNVASATKLQTARTIWGQNFDGTANVSGSLTGVGSITANDIIKTYCSARTTWISAFRGMCSSMAAGDFIQMRLGQSESSRNEAYIGFKYAGAGSTSNYLSLGLHSVDYALNILGNGNVGIGTTSPAHKLDVNGVTRSQYYLATSTTLCSNLNADLLDGVHKEGLLTQFTTLTNGSAMVYGHRVTVGGTYKDTTYNGTQRFGFKTITKNDNEGRPVIYLLADVTSWSTATSGAAAYGGTFTAHAIREAGDASLTSTVQITAMCSWGNTIYTLRSSNPSKIEPLILNRTSDNKVFLALRLWGVSHYIDIVGSIINCPLWQEIAVSASDTNNLPAGYTLRRGCSRWYMQAEMDAYRLEIYGATPCIDFHFNSSSADYTSRIIESASGRLAIPGKLSVGGYVNDSYALSAASFICNSWVRTSGATGWYSETYGGGWYMTDTNWIRSYGGKSIYHNSGILRTDGTFQVGADGATMKVPAGADIIIGQRLGPSVDNNLRLGWDGRNFEGVHSRQFINNTNTTMWIWQAKNNEMAFATNGYGRMCITSAGGVVIGANGYVPSDNSPGVLRCTKGMYSDGYVSAKGSNTSSDMRLKNKKGDVYLTPKSIAQAPVFRFLWKRGPVSKTADVGSSAQYWLNVLNEAVHLEADGYYSLDYAKTALCSVVSLAKAHLSLEERVKALEAENKELKEMLNLKNLE